MNTENDIKMKELAEHFQQEQPHLMRYACYRLGDTDDVEMMRMATNLKPNSVWAYRTQVRVALGRLAGYE